MSLTLTSLRLGPPPPNSATYQQPRIHSPITQSHPPPHGPHGYMISPDNKLSHIQSDLAALARGDPLHTHGPPSSASPQHAASTLSHAPPGRGPMPPRAPGMLIEELGFAPSGSMPHGSMPSDSMLHGSMPHGSMPHGSMPHGSMPPGSRPGPPGPGYMQLDRMQEHHTMQEPYHSGYNNRALTP